MIRIGIVGSDNSHALAFARLANVDRALGDRCRVVGIWGADPQKTAEVAQEGAIPVIVAKPADLLDQIDLAVVVDRHGELHAEHALPFLERGLPTFVDKPFAISLADCQRMLDTAKQHGAVLTSFSALRFAPETEALTAELSRVGSVRAAQFAGPCDFASEYGGPFFYATHVIELALRLVGNDVAAVSATRNGPSVLTVLTFGSGAIASLALLGDAAYHFYATLFGTEGMTSREVRGGAATYARTIEQIVRMAETGRAPLEPAQLLQPIRIVHAIVESLDQGGKSVSLIN